LVSSNIATEILYKGTIFTHVGRDPYARDATYPFNHAPSIVRLSDGRLLTVWFAGPWEGSHLQCLLGSFSSDNGHTWSPAEVLQKTHDAPDFDPAFIRDEKRVWLFYSLHRRYAALPPFETGYVGTFAKYTDDNGDTWSAPRMLAAKSGPRNNGIRLSNGDLLIGNWSEKSCGVLKSRDKGETWERRGEIPGPNNDEPTVTELSNGTILMYLRAGDGYMWKSTSEDNGETWAPNTRTEIVAANSSHHIFKLSNGHLALSYNACKPPYRSPLVLRFSVDDGKTWGKPIIVDEITVPEDLPGWSRQVTYPSIAEDSDGNVIIVWARIVFGEREAYGDIKVARVAEHLK